MTIKQPLKAPSISIISQALEGAVGAVEPRGPRRERLRVARQDRELVQLGAGAMA